MASDVRIPSRIFRFSPRVLLLLLILVVLAVGLAAWLLRPTAVNVLMTVEPYSFCRYDDGAGHLPLGALVRVTNLSNSTVWCLRSTRVQYELVDGKWSFHTTSFGAKPREPGQWMAGPYRWTALHTTESITILASPISENATEMKVAVPFTTEWFPTKAHWVFCPVVKIVKKGQDFFPEVKEGAKQEEEVLPLP